MQEQVYQRPIHDVNALKQPLLHVWATFHQKIIDYFVNLNFGRYSLNHHIFSSIEQNVTLCWTHILRWIP